MSNQTTPLNKLGELADKQAIPGVQGIITNVFDRRTGTNKQGKNWSVQHVMIKEDGESVKVEIWDKDEISKSATEEYITITAASSSRGLSGVYIKDSEFKGRSTRVVRTTSSAIINIETDQYEEPEPEPEQKKQDQTPPQKQKPKEFGPEAEAKEEIMRLANLYLLANKAVEDYISPSWEKMTGRNLTEERRGAIATSIVIAAERKGLTHKMPCRPMY